MAVTRAFSCLVVLVSVFFSSIEAKEFLVGGRSDAWKIPSSSQPDSLNQWAQSSRFSTGDSLVWKYEVEKDSVLQVTEEAYLSCNTSSPIAEYKDGNSKVKLERSGAFYFISGAKGHCGKGQKVIVVVMAERHGRYTGLSPAPSPAEDEGPAVAPTSRGVNLKSSWVSMGLGIFGLGVVFLM